MRIRSGTVPNLKFSFADAHPRLEPGGWAREVTERELPVAVGDVGYVPQAMGHYVENTGAKRLRFLELFRSDRFSDVSLSQWLASTPAPLVAAHLGVDEGALGGLSAQEQRVM